MADISTELRTIQQAEFGAQVRTAIHDAIFKINEEGGGSGQSMRVGVVQQVVDHEGIILNRVVGVQHQRVMSEYEGVLPETVYDAVESICEQYDLGIDECQILYILQGRVKGENIEPYQQYYKVIVIPMATVPTNSVMEVYSSTDPMYEDELFYTVKRSTGTMYYTYADAINGFDPSTTLYGEAILDSGWYRISDAFHNCYLNNDGSKQHWLPMHCNTTFNPSIIIAYDDNVEFITT